MSNNKTVTKNEQIALLKAQIKVLRKVDRVAAASLQARVKELQGGNATDEQAVTMYFEDGHIHVRTPGIKKRGRGAMIAMAINLKKAATLGDEKLYSFDKKTETWSFRALPPVVDAIKRVLGDFFSEAPILNKEGKRNGQLPASTYQGKA